MEHPPQGISDSYATSSVGVSGVSKVLHSARHTIQTRLRGIVAPDIIKRLVGHKDEGMTDHYTTHFVSSVVDAERCPGELLGDLSMYTSG
jgi:integrase